MWAKTELNATLVPAFTIGSNLAPPQQEDIDQQMISLSPDWANRVAELYKESNPDFSSMKMAPSLALALSHTASRSQAAPVSLSSESANPDKRGVSQSTPQSLLTEAQYFAASAYFEANKAAMSQYTDIYLHTSTNWTDPASLFHLEVEILLPGYG